jgi:aryl-alcohol dehydrogenase-like predicted oxidoreductase
MTTRLSTMPLRRCGSSDLMLPMLGIGGWQFGGGDYWGAQSQTDVDAVVRHAIDHGCNFFDTAESYNGGASEISLGLALRGIPRDRVIIGTKISPGNTAPAKVTAHCDASLRRLQVDHIDVYMAGHYEFALRKPQRPGTRRQHSRRARTDRHRRDRRTEPDYRSRIARARPELRLL